MTVLQELLVTAATASEAQLARALAALKRSEIEAPLEGYASLVEICRRYAGTDGKPLAKSTVYRRLKAIGVSGPSKKIGGESYFRDLDVLLAFGGEPERVPA
jgi:hypothetical protein